MTIDAREFRHTLGRFATGIAVATTLDGEGNPVGVTVNSVTSVSLDPPLVLFCLDRNANTLPLFQSGRGFALNILTEEQRDFSHRFSRGHATDRWDGVPRAAWETGSPILEGCLANLDCELYGSHEGGDHVIIVGKVVKLAFAAEGRPLLYWCGAYRHID
ncbi:MAG TPA: flavin reductase family protein [Azospirillaceae bacterium]|nr:flavin reductase family protein [Azospirillaceae bacterium]